MKNTIMDMFILLTVLQILSLNEAYNFTCPSQGHWIIRATSMCKPPENYTCLFNVTFRVNVYRDICNKPRILHPGYKYVFQPNLNRATCSATRYQPFIFYTIGNSDCTYQKSLCSSLGQETYKIGNTTVDRKCICNTDKGYSFVRNPKNQCYCNPSTEDCSCYLGINPYNETVELKGVSLAERMNCNIGKGRLKSKLSLSWSPQELIKFIISQLPVLRGRSYEMLYSVSGGALKKIPEEINTQLDESILEWYKEDTRDPFY